MMDNQEVIIPSTQKPKSNKLMIVLIIINLFLTLSFLYFGYQFSISQKQKLTLPTPTLSISPSAETTSWETYSSTKLSISFKYPKDLNLTESDISVHVGKDPDIRPVVDACPGFAFSVGKFDPQANYQFYLPVKKTTFNNQPVEISERTDVGCILKAIFVNQFPTETTKPKLVIGTTSKSANIYLFDQILSTFKFLPEDKPNISLEEPKGKCQNPSDRERTEISVSNNVVKFSGTLINVSPCDKLSAKLETLKNDVTVFLSNTGNSDICIECLGALDFSGTVNGLPSGTYTLKVILENKDQNITLSQKDIVL